MNKRKTISIIIILVSFGLLFAIAAMAFWFFTTFGPQKYMVNLPYAVSPDGKTIACRIGPKSLGFSARDQYQMLVVQDEPFLLNWKNWMVVPHSGLPTNIDWRPGVETPELWFRDYAYDTFLTEAYVMYCVHEDLERLSSVKISGNWPLISSSPIPSNQGIYSIKWDPKGEILAFMLEDEMSDGDSWNTFLGFSYDEGENIFPTDIEMYKQRIVWADSSTLYVVGIDKIL